MKDKIIYIKTPIEEKPVINGPYTVMSENGEIRIWEWIDDHFLWMRWIMATHWLKPINLSDYIQSLIDSDEPIGNAAIRYASLNMNDDIYLNSSSDEELVKNNIVSAYVDGFNYAIEKLK